MIEAGQRVLFRTPRELIAKDGTRVVVEDVVAKPGERFARNEKDGTRRGFIARVPYDGSTRQQRRAIARAQRG